ncbi:MAG: hypothetical protein WA885_15010 [Phormidesmis sp.]
MKMQAGGWMVDDAERQRHLKIYADLLISAADAGTDWPELGRLHSHLGEAHDYLEQCDQAETHYRAAVHCFNAAAMARQAAQTYLHLGEVQAALARPTMALASFSQALMIGDRLADTSLQGRSLYLLGQLKESTGELENALNDYRQAERLIGLASGCDDNQGQEELRSRILASMVAVQTAIALQRALDLAEQLNDSFEVPKESDLPEAEFPGPSRGLPDTPEASRGPRPQRLGDRRKR